MFFTELIHKNLEVCKMSLFTHAQLRSTTGPMYKSVASQILLNEARKFDSTKTYDIFLSHSYADSEEILSLKQIIEGLGYSTYVDWIEDRELDRSNVTKNTANLIKLRMKTCKCLFFVTTENYPNSKWMPWELGFFDGFKPEKVAILPIVQSSYGNQYTGQEYLGIYPFISYAPANGTSNSILWINDDSNTYTQFSLWLNGQKPTKHS
jgi:hypothetical protein